MIIVAGVARSGTSMMMHLLHVGGMDVLWDSPNTRSRYNLNGLYEHPDNVKVATEDPQRDIAVKIGALRIPDYVENFLDLHPAESLPPIIVTRRPFEASAQSWNSIFARPDQPQMGERRTAESVGQTMAALDVAIASHRHLDIDYDAMVDDPGAYMDSVIEFVGRPMDRAAMIAAVNPEYRHY